MGFGFAFVVLLPMSTADHSWEMFMGLHPVYESVWLWVGSGSGVSDRGTIDDVVGEEMPTAIVMPTLMWMYLFIIGVLLVNLLIAMMSDTYAKVMEKGTERWTFERAQLILEFKDTKAPLPPPFNLLWQLFTELPAMWSTVEEDEVDVSGFRVVPDLKLLKKLEIAEAAHLRTCVEMQEKREQEEMSWQIQDIGEKLKKMEETSRAQYEHLTRQLDRKGA